MNKILLFFAIMAIMLNACVSRKVLAPNAVSECKFLNDRKTPSQILKILCDTALYSDSSKFKSEFKSLECFEIVMNKLFQNAKMEPSWQCDFAGCHYPVLSLKKSVYKIDLIRLMKYYDCPDTTLLFSMTSGNFSKSDIDLITNTNRYKTEYNIDTSIVYATEHKQ